MVNDWKLADYMVFGNIAVDKMVVDKRVIVELYLRKW
jgi:hypothetical protein